MRLLALALAIYCLVQDDPYAVAKKMKETLAAAKTVRIKVQGTLRGGAYTMDVRVKGGKFDVRASGLPEVKGEVSLTSDGRAIAVDNLPRWRGEATYTAEDFPAARLTAFTGPVLLGVIPKEDVALSEDDLFLKSGGREKVGGVELLKLEYVNVPAGRRRQTMRGTTWIDIGTGLPVKQVLTLDDTAIAETYTITLNEEIPDSVFALQSKRRVTEAVARQLARAVELYQAYQGVAPAGIDGLTKKPEGDAFWPQGGFWIGPVPKDAWGRPLVLEKGQVVSLGADGKAGGKDDDADLRLDVVAPAGWRICPTTDRLKELYAARIQIQLLQGAVDAFRFALRGAPKSFDELVTRPSNVEFWPEGGFIASAPAKRYEYANGGVNCPSVKRVKIRALTEDERKALEKAASVPLPEAEQKEVARQLERLKSEEVEARDEAAKALERVGPRVLPILEKRIAAEKDAEVRSRMEQVRGRVIAAPPTWQTELSGRNGPTRSGPKVDTACVNNLAQLWKMQHNYMVQYGGSSKSMPKETGADFWLKLSRVTPPLIDSSLKDIFICPGSGADDDECTYWGPKVDVEKHNDGDPVGMCDESCHGDSVVILRKSGDVLFVLRNDPLYASAKEMLKPPE